MIVIILDARTELEDERAGIFHQIGPVHDLLYADDTLIISD